MPLGSLHSVSDLGVVWTMSGGGEGGRVGAREESPRDAAHSPKLLWTPRPAGDATGEVQPGDCPQAMCRVTERCR